MVAFPNPDGFDVYADQIENREEVGDIWDAARAAGVKPGTIRVWITRGKIEPVLRGEAGDLFHLPTIVTASKNPPGRRKAA